jgi:hypothetical protein
MRSNARLTGRPRRRAGRPGLRGRECGRCGCAGPACGALRDAHRRPLRAPGRAAGRMAEACAALPVRVVLEGVFGGVARMAGAIRRMVVPGPAMGVITAVRGRWEVAGWPRGPWRGRSSTSGAAASMTRRRARWPAATSPTADHRVGPTRARGLILFLSGGSGPWFAHASGATRTRRRPLRLSAPAVRRPRSAGRSCRGCGGSDSDHRLGAPR